MPDDEWTAGDAYEAYMGRWSRPLARVFVEWLHAGSSSHWLDVGCGTGALTSTICERCEPATIVACDPSGPFIEHARRSLSDARVSFVIAGIDALPERASGFDTIVSGLVLNFLPDPAKAMASLCARLASDGVLAAYVWDYSDGMEFLRSFWEEAAALDPRAAGLDEGRRFPLCQAQALESLFREAGLERVATDSLEIATDFADFEDYWKPFLSGTGPAPSYVMSLEPATRDALKAKLEQRLSAARDGLRLRARAWAVRGQQGR